MPNPKPVPMPLVTLLTGAILIALGVIGRFATGTGSGTALIPAYAGLVFVVLGLLASKESLRKHVMHVAAIFGLLGATSLGMGIPGLLQGKEGRGPLMQTLMGLVCLVFLILCIRSFVAVRRARKAEGGSDRD